MLAGMPALSPLLTVQAMEAMLEAELEGQNDFEDDYDGLSGQADSAGADSAEVDSAGGSPRAADAAPDGVAAAAPALAAAAAEAPAVLPEVSGGEVQGSAGPGPQGARAAAAAAAAAASVVRSQLHEGPGDSSTVMCADMHADAAEEHASAAPGGFAVDGVMRWGKKRKR